MAALKPTYFKDVSFMKNGAIYCIIQGPSNFMIYECHHVKNETNIAMIHQHVSLNMNEEYFL